MYYFRFSHNFLDDYQVFFIGPSNKAKIGSTIELTCFTMTEQHHPVWFEVSNSQDAEMKVRPENISLPSGEQHMGIVVPIRNVSSDDGGNYTCEAIWEKPNYTRTAAYTLEVACKYSNFHQQ